MPRVSLAALLPLVLWLWPAAIVRADETADQKLLKAAGVSEDGPALLEFFRKRTFDEATRTKIGQLIKQLGADEFTVREKAFNDLAALGSLADPLIRQAMNQTDQDVEVLHSCVKLLKKNEATPNNAVAGAAARTALKLKPDGLAEVLLAYLPFADDLDVTENVQSALTAVAYAKEKPNAILEKALDDKFAERRAAVAEALLQGGSTVHAGAKKLLTDADTTVRLRVALALVQRKDRDAFPVLVNLLTELPVEKVWRAEEPLLMLAGDAAPQPPLETNDQTRKKYRDAWEAWYQKEGTKIDLARLDEPPFFGYTLSVFMDQQFINGTVAEYGKDGKVRWQVKGLQFPIDAQVLQGGERVLVAEANGMRVTERTTADGKVQWDRRFNAQPVACRRLPNGNTFIACQNQLVEIDRNGKDVFTFNRPNYDIMGAAKLRNGEYGFVTNVGGFIRIDAGGKVLKTLNIGQAGTFSGIDSLPNGNVLVPQFNMGKVVEYDKDGKSVWEAAVQQPTSVQRLPDGNTLVASMMGQLYEFDAKGKKVWDQKVEGRPWRTSRR
jgi:hypothetical protein